MKSLAGVHAPLTTPFDPDGTLNLSFLAENIRLYAQSGIHGYLVLGSNGENKSLTRKEKMQVLHTVIRNKAADQVAMVGSIFESTRETIEFAQEAVAGGADFITLLPPCYFKSQMKDETLIRYFTDVASVVQVPCLLYKAPQFSGGVDIGISVMKACSAHPNIVGIKDSSSGNVEKILHAAPDNFSVMSGSANSFLSALLNGGVGGVISLANSFPGVALAVYDHYRAGRLQEAVALNNRMIGVNIGISGKYGVAGVKHAMYRAGYHGGDPRLPLLPLDTKGKAEIDVCLSDWDFG